MAFTGLTQAALGDPRETQGALRKSYFNSKTSCAFASRLAFVLACVGLLLGAAGAATPALKQLTDRLDQPVTPAQGRVGAQATRSLVTAIARHGDHMLAVGARGLIMVSRGAGTNWRQVASPVSADLVAVRFATATTVWAVGHDAVILRSLDAGENWERVMDGRTVLQLLRKTYPAATATALAREIESSAAQSATPDVWAAPFLDIWFNSAGHGWAVGAFGLILHTTDGGQRWQPWFNETENEQRYHLYALTGQGEEVYIAGEHGLVLRLDAANQRFKRLETPYSGTFFGINQQGSQLIAYGLRGNAYASGNAGAQWQKIETGVDANLVAAVARGETLYLVSQSGDVLSASLAQGRATKVASSPGAEVYGAALTPNAGLALARLNGVAVLALPAQDP